MELVRAEVARVAAPARALRFRGCAGDATNPRLGVGAARLPQGAFDGAPWVTPTRKGRTMEISKDQSTRRDTKRWPATRVIGMVFASIGGLIALALLVGGITVLATYAFGRD